MYFFGGFEYLRYDISQERVDSDYPISISSGWSGFGRTILMYTLPRWGKSVLL
ncbi:hemopexin repeat-containing protein [Bacillus toyonensis]|uniref:hemopexin repeat-containing protein n=1 Tax=Bacillus toyonensis TaxID=155322 RepID=UPI000BFCFE89|nr:hypothetical protein COF39_17295 [Bacillus toyonensis]